MSFRLDAVEEFCEDGNDSVEPIHRKEAFHWEARRKVFAMGDNIYRRDDPMTTKSERRVHLS